MKNLLLIVPSRGRPENVRRLVDSIVQTDTHDVDLIVGIDKDDPRWLVYEFDWREGDWRGGDWAYKLCTRSDLRQVVPWLNYLAVKYASEYRYIGTVGDDNVFKTPQWDMEIVSSLYRQQREQGMGFCWGNDLHPHRPSGSLATHVFMTSNIIRKLGYMGPRTLRHMYVDNVWTAWAKQTSYEYLRDVVIEHLHPSAQKAEMDQNYADSESYVYQDQRQFEFYTHDPQGLRADIAQIQSLGRVSDPSEPS